MRFRFILTFLLSFSLVSSSYAMEMEEKTDSAKHILTLSAINSREEAESGSSSGDIHRGINYLSDLEGVKHSGKKTILKFIDFLREGFTSFSSFFSSNNPRSANTSQYFSIFLPSETVNHILSFLCVEDLGKLRRVSRNFKQLADESISSREVKWYELSAQAKGYCEMYLKTSQEEEGEEILPSVLLALISLEFSEQFDFIAKKLPSKIQIFSLDRLKLGNEAVFKSLEIIKDSSVHTLYLSSNNIDDNGVIWLARGVIDTELHTLHLEDNKIGNKGAIGFCRDLRGSKVKTVYLAFNDIKDEGAIEFANNLWGTRLRRVNLFNNKISDSCKDLLRKDYSYIDSNTRRSAPEVEWDFDSSY